MHKFPYKWHLTDGYPAKGIEYHGMKVFGTFICGGGSTMGYKLAGFNHLGGVEIDPKIADVYKTNHNPKHLYIEDIRDFANLHEYPDELYNLDLLDGSPPCSSFSMAGNREKDWGKEKVFKEGQAKQRLDDLFFDYIKLAKKLQPKVVIAENVKGLISGNAKSYVHRIKKEFELAGYKVQLFLLNAASMGVPQKRQRVFFICQRNDLNLPKLKLEFNEKAITVENCFNNSKNVVGNKLGEKSKALFEKTPQGKSLSFAHPNGSYFNWIKLSFEGIAPTVAGAGGTFGNFAAGSPLIHPEQPNEVHPDIYKLFGTFPMDYNFKSVDTKYLIGMSVPPVMTAQIAHQIYLQWLSK
jgi:DNA (cytosine-5)-methyltransferase 1